MLRLEHFLFLSLLWSIGSWAMDKPHRAFILGNNDHAAMESYLGRPMSSVLEEIHVEVKKAKENLPQYIAQGLYDKVMNEKTSDPEIAKAHIYIATLLAIAYPDIKLKDVTHSVKVKSEFSDVVIIVKFEK